jgi:hypothetical protein
MKHFVFLKLFIFLSLSLAAQDYIAPNQPRVVRKFQISATFSPNVAFRTLKAIEEINPIVNLKTERDEIETPRFGYQCGVRFGYYFIKNVGIETGVLYARKGYQSKWQEDSDNTITEWRYRQNFECIDVPLLINFRSNHGKVRFIANIGIIFNHLVRDNAVSDVKYTNETIGKFTRPGQGTYKSFNLSGTVGFGLDIPFASRLGFQIKPNFRYGFLKIIEAPLTGFVWDAGLELRFYVEI